MFIQVISLMVASFIQTTNLGFNIGYLFSLFFICQSFKYVQWLKFSKKTFIQIIISLALVINLLLKIIYEENFQTLSSFIVLISYLHFTLILHFFSSKKFLSTNKLNFYKTITIFYNRIFYPFLAIEFLTRLLKYQSGLPWYYAIKDSFFYFDSNFLGLYLVLSFLLVVILTDFSNRKKHIFIHIIFIFLSTSRTSITCAGLLLLVIKYKPVISKLLPLSHRLLKIIILLILGIFIWKAKDIVTLISEIIYNTFSGLDGSLNTKINLFMNILDFLSLEDIQGLGFGNYQYSYSIWAHSLLNMYLMEGGAINFILLISLLCFSFCDSPVGIIIFFIILTQGLSIFSYNIISIGVVIAVYTLVQKTENFSKKLP